MKINDNQSKRIYDKTNKQWYEIPEDQYREYDRWRTALRKRMQYRGECFCPRSKWWLCGSNCLDGEFRNNTIIALDDPLPDGEGTLADYVPDNAPLIGAVLAEKSELNQLLERLQELSASASSARKASPMRPSPIKSSDCTSRKCRLRQTPAATRKHRCASLSYRNSSEASGPASQSLTIFCPKAYPANHRLR